MVQRHNEVRDTVYDLAATAWGQTTKEPVIGESLENSSGVSLRADLGVRGVWQTQVTALFDVRVIDTDAKSYVGCTPQSVLKKPRRKKYKYLNACEEKHVSFTPLCFSVDGNEAKTFLKRLAECLSDKWHKPYSTIMYWIKAKLNFALVVVMAEHHALIELDHHSRDGARS